MFYPITAIALLTLFFILQKRYPALKRYLLLTNIIITIIYFIWRFTVVPTRSIPECVLGILLLLAEILGLIQITNMQILFSRPYILPLKTLSDFKGEVPAVDILICTYNESVELLEKTLLCALNLNYDKSRLDIYICDDGHRDEVKELCDAYQAGYITRNGNEGAKAGNINNALKHTHGDLFAVLDADMLVTKVFLERTVGYFTDADTSFVQTPQVYYNKDMYQRNLNKLDIPNEQDFFMRDIQSGRAVFNAVLHVGTNAVFRRSHVMEIGMYPTNSITEDMAVGMLLQAKGYHSIFINEPLVLGISVSNYTDLAIQRDRWCRGNLQVISHFNPFFKKGLTLIQKIIYFDGTIYWFTSFQKMIYLICPTLFLLTGIRAMNADFASLVKVFLPYFIGTILLFRTIAPDSRSLKWAHIYEVAMAPHTCASILKQLFSLKIDFRVTPKENRDDKAYFQLQVILPHLILGIITLVSWIWGFFLLKGEMISLSSFIINMFWSIYNGIGIYICIRVAYHLAKGKPFQYSSIGKKNTIKLEIECTYSSDLISNRDTMLYNINITNLGESGLKFHYEKRIHIQPENVSCPASVFLPYKGNIVKVLGRIREAEESGEYYFQFTELSPRVKMVLMEFYMEHLRPVYPISSKQKYI